MRIADDLLYIPLNNYEASCHQLTFGNIVVNDTKSMYFNGLDIHRIDNAVMTITFRQAPSSVTIHSRCVCDVGYNPSEVVDRYIYVK